jgi:hypothetical protein
MELLTEKFAEILESSKMPQIAESEKSSMALILENQANEETRIMSESTVAADVAQFVPIFMPLARRVQPTLIANELVGVQPMTSPTGYLYTLAFKYTGMGANAADKTGGRISPVAGGQIVEITGNTLSKGDVISSDNTQDSNVANVIYVEGDLVLVDAKVFSAGDDVYDNAATPADLGVDVKASYSNELTFRKILKGYTGSLPTSQAELLGYDMSEIGFEVKQTSIAAESRKLKAEYTVEMYQDLKAMHGLNADEELMNMMAVEIQNEMDREIVDKVNGWAAPAGDFKVGGTTVGTDVSGSARFELEGMAHLGIKIANESREIARLTRRGAGNVLLVSPKVATILENLKGFKAIESASSVGVGVGASVIGKFNGMKVVQDSFATTDYCTVLYKGADRRDAIGYYAPYVPVSFTRVVHPESGQPAIILNTRYGIKENPLNENEGVYARTFTVTFDEKSVLA